MKPDRLGRLRAQVNQIAKDIQHPDLSQQTVKSIRDSLIEDAVQVAAYAAPDGSKRSLRDDQTLAGAAVRFVQKRPTAQDLAVLADQMVSASVVEAKDEDLGDGYTATVTIKVNQVFSGDAQKGALLQFRQRSSVTAASAGDASEPSASDDLYVLSRGFYEHTATGAGKTPSTNASYLSRLINTMRKVDGAFVPYELSTLAPIPLTSLSGL